MKFALLGADSESMALAKAAKSLGHTIAWCGDFADDYPSEADWLGTDQGELWEGLLDGTAIDAVVVGRGAAEASVRSDQLSQLAKSSMPVLTSFPLVDSVLNYYEIDMAHGEADGVLQHFNPLIEQLQIVQQCIEWIANGHATLGPIEQIVWDRPLAERTQSNVLWHFSRDVELLSLISGGLNRLGALGSADEAATYSGLSVQLLGRREVPVRWQVGPIERDSHPRLVLIAQHGKLTIAFDESGGQAQFTEASGGDETTSAPYESIDAATQCVRRFVDVAQAVGGKAESTWSSALAAMELTDTIEIALRRGRMIEVHQQQLTEQMAFKGTMSAVGCGVLLTIPPLLLLCGWIAELAGLSIARYWPHALLSLLAVFLGLQVLPKLVFNTED
ncbi:MAG: hypothetical protein AAGD11_02195 [Planctomycetota bacterium]